MKALCKLKLVEQYFLLYHNLKNMYCYSSAYIHGELEIAWVHKSSKNFHFLIPLLAL